MTVTVNVFRTTGSTMLGSERLIRVQFPGHFREDWEMELPTAASADQRLTRVQTINGDEVWRRQLSREERSDRREAMARMPQEDEWYRVGQLGQHVVASNPDFDTRTYGASKLSELVGGLRGFETKRQGNILYVRYKAQRSKS